MRLWHTSGTRKFAVGKLTRRDRPASQNRLIRYKSKKSSWDMVTLFVFAGAALGPKFVLLNLQCELAFIVADDASPGH